MNVRSILIAAAAVLLSSTAVAADSSIKATATSGDGAFIAATLAPYGSFEFIAAPSYTKLALVRRGAIRTLRRDTEACASQAKPTECTGKAIARAESLQKRADDVRRLLDHSVTACAQNNKTGVCKGDQVKAFVLLSEASARLAAL